jgi:putative transposase
MRLLQPLFALFATSSNQELAHKIEYLKGENRILREKLPTRITVTDRERARLLKLGKKIGSALKALITIVSYRTFTRWVASESEKTDADKPAAKKSTRKPGRPKTAEEIRDLVIKLAKDNEWGYTRVLGELKKLRVRVSRSTVINILKEAGLDPGPKRGKGTWDEFIKIHASTLWACDFLTVRSATLTGFVDLYLLFFIHVGSRRAFIAGITPNPTGEWTAQQARNATMQMTEWGLPATYLLLDHDSKFTDQFDAVFQTENREVKRVGPLAPNLNAFAERFAQTLRHELLDYFIVLGEKHLRYITKEFMDHYNEERPHQGVGNVPLPRAASPAPKDSEPATLPFPSGKIQCKERFGGLIKHYHREAA